MAKNVDEIIAIVKDTAEGKLDKEVLCEELYSEVYALVYPVCGDEKVSRVQTKKALIYFCSNLDKIDFSKNIHRQIATMVSLYLFSQVDTEEIDNSKHYEYKFDKLKEDQKLYDYVKKNVKAFRSPKAYDNAPDRFINLTALEMVVLELFGYEMYSLKEIESMVNTDITSLEIVLANISHKLYKAPLVIREDATEAEAEAEVEDETEAEADIEAEVETEAEVEAKAEAEAEDYEDSEDSEESEDSEATEDGYVLCDDDVDEAKDLDDSFKQMGFLSNIVYDKLPDSRFKTLFYNFFSLAGGTLARIVLSVVSVIIVFLVSLSILLVIINNNNTRTTIKRNKKKPTNSVVATISADRETKAEITKSPAIIDNGNNNNNANNNANNDGNNNADNNDDNNNSDNKDEKTSEEAKETTKAEETNQTSSNTQTGTDKNSETGMTGSTSASVGQTIAETTKGNEDNTNATAASTQAADSTVAPATKASQPTNVPVETTAAQPDNQPVST